MGNYVNKSIIINKKIDKIAMCIMEAMDYGKYFECKRENYVKR